jgi:hypothetical protein
MHTDADARCKAHVHSCGAWGTLAISYLHSLCLIRSVSLTSILHIPTGLALQRMAFGCLRVGIRCRAALTTAIARKCYNMAHLDKDTAATAVGFVASDVNKIFEGIQEIHYLWGAPIEAAAILALLATLVGIYSLPGVGIVCAIVPAQYYFGFRIIKNKVANSANTNARYAIIQELLPAMKLVKYYAWERFFEREVRRRGGGGCCALLCCWLLCSGQQAAAAECCWSRAGQLLMGSAIRRINRRSAQSAACNCG